MTRTAVEPGSVGTTEGREPNPTTPVEHEGLADLFSRLDDVLVEESPMHPFGCATWEESSGIAIDMAKDRLRTQAAELERLRGALETISTLEPEPFEGGLDMDAIKACDECQRYAGHPVQQGICNIHRQPLWARERHESHAEKAMGWKARSIARRALSEVGEA